MVHSTGIGERAHSPKARSPLLFLASGLQPAAALPDAPRVSLRRTDTKTRNSAPCNWHNFCIFQLWSDLTTQAFRCDGYRIDQFIPSPEWTREGL